MHGAAAAARARGYAVAIVEDPVVGEAREAAKQYASRVGRWTAEGGLPRCVISSGETTVRVVGGGRGGRNQEFALAVALYLQPREPLLVLGSLGTDGIDGPTDAAGAMIDSTTLERARQAGVGEGVAFLDRNDAYSYFSTLGDLIVTGPSGTNVGDLQVLLLG